MSQAMVQQVFVGPTIKVRSRRHSVTCGLAIHKKCVCVCKGVLHQELRRKLGSFLKGHEPGFNPDKDPNLDGPTLLERVFDDFGVEQSVRIEVPLNSMPPHPLSIRLTGESKRFSERELQKIVRAVLGKDLEVTFKGFRGHK